MTPALANSHPNGHAPDARPVGWAVVGTGWVARDYAGPGIEASANGRVVAACDLDADALAAFLPHRADLARTRDLGEMLARDDVEAVYVATPNHVHAAPVRAAARAGKAVLCEKPLARTAHEAAALAEVVRGAGVPFGVAFDQRHHPAHARLRALVADGALGEVTAVRIRYACWTGPDWSPDGAPLVPGANWRADPARAGGGAFIDLAPHGLDLAQWLLGDTVVEVAALLQRRVHDYDVDDGAALVGRTARGALLNLSVAYNCPETFPRRELEVVGTRARALALNTMGQTPGGTLTLTDAATGEARPVAFDAAACPFRLQAEAFAGALRAGRAFGPGVERELHTMRLLDAAAGEPAARVPVAAPPRQRGAARGLPPGVPAAGRPPAS